MPLLKDGHSLPRILIVLWLSRPHSQVSLCNKFLLKSANRLTLAPQGQHGALRRPGYWIKQIHHQARGIHFLGHAEPSGRVHADVPIHLPIRITGKDYLIHIEMLCYRYTQGPCIGRLCDPLGAPLGHRLERARREPYAQLHASLNRNLRG